MKCNNCGKKLRIDDKFCSRCGTEVDWTKESYEVAPEEAKEVRTKKASKWIIVGVSAAAGIAAVFTALVAGNAVHSMTGTEQTEVASETEAESETSTETQETTTTTQQPTTQPATTEVETREPESTAPTWPETSRSREGSGGYGYRDGDSYNDGYESRDSYDYDYGYDNRRQYDYDENYAEGWLKAMDDYEDDGLADDIWDYLRTRGGQIWDTYEYGQQSVYDSIENIRNKFF